MNHPEFKRICGIVMLLALASFIFAACSQEPETVEVTRIVEVPIEINVETEPVEVEVPIEVTRVVEVEVMPETAVSVIPFEEQWASSAHADASAEAFVHWNEDDPAEVSEHCAKCHSTSGFKDFVGADGTEFGSVEASVPVGEVITCEACHNEATVDLDHVTFPSGIDVTGLDSEARCMQCHQGRNSKVQVDEGIVEAGLDPVADLDTISEEVGFSNIHYYPAAATQFGTVAMGGYEYDGKTYDAKFDHVEGYDTCVSCHDPHTLEIQFEECSTCHEGLDSTEDLPNIRMFGSLVDYNGNGDIEEGIQAEIEGLQDILYQTMQAYADDVGGAPIVYDSHSYPYFFADTDGNGEAGEGDERYGTWTPRLAKAAYNYQMSQKDPGKFAHGGKYIIQLLYDSIEDLNMAISAPADMSALNRIDHGHFAGSEEAFRHWDEDGAVPGSCSKCHSAAGLPLFLTEGVSISQAPANGLNCATCHNDLTEFTLHESPSVKFPSGATVTFADNDLESNTCLNCHQGRESAVSVNRVIGDLADNEQSESLRFINVHYFAAGASLFGGETQGAYEYEGQDYVGKNEHVGPFNSCTECHDTHALEVVVEDCSDCHEGATTVEALRNIRDEDNTIDYDGDGDAEEGIASEIETMRELLLAGMQDYALNTVGTGILYDSHSYPYYFTDLNGDGEGTPDEVNYGGRYVTWTPKLLRSAYNYQYATKDTGGYAHNGKYIMQTLYDSMQDMGVDVSAMTRPVSVSE